MQDLQAWTERIRADVDRLMADFADRFGYPPDENVVVVGSDGGGALYVVPLGDTAPVLRVEEAAIVDGVLRPLREQQVRELAADVPSFLRALADAVEECADGSTPAF